jgi:hypothetical protein
MKQFYRLGAGLSVLLLAGAAPTLAQTFTHAQPVGAALTASSGSNVLEIVTDAAGSSYVTGFFAGTVTIGGTTLTSAGGNDVFVAKYDAAGVAQWAVRGGGTGDDIATAIALDASGNIGITGSYGGGAAGTFGPTTLANAGSQDMFVAKLGNTGTWLWAQRVSGADTELGQSLAFDSSGSLYAVGFYQSPSVSLSGTGGTYSNFNAPQAASLLVKYAANGSYLSARNLTSSTSLYANALAIDASDNLYLYGDFSGTAALGSTTLYSLGGQDLFVARLTPALAYTWVQSAGGLNDDFAPSGRSLAVEANGNAYLTGRSYSDALQFDTALLMNANTNGDAFILSLTGSGNWRWGQRAGGTGQDRGEAVALDGKGNLYATGDFAGTASFDRLTLTSAGGSDAYVAKLTTDGVYLSASRAGGPLDDGGSGVASDVTGNLYNVGYYASPSAEFGPINLANAGTQTGYFARSLADLTVSAPGQASGGIYNNVTIAGSGSTTLGSFLVANGTMTVQNGGSLNLNCQPLTGAGSFTLQAGGTLYICNPLGIVRSGASGAVQVNGNRSFDPDALYFYNGTAAQVTGNALPGRVRALGTLNAASVTLTSPVQVAQTLTVGSSGNLVTGGNALTLLSRSTGTALAVNSGTGTVQGTATVQRYIDGSRNAGLGYRHYSSPVTGATVGSLATSSFVPVLTQSYNSSATPGTTRPFPNVFAYDQRRLSTSSNNSPVFDKGFVVPVSGDALTPGQGYAVNIGAGELVNFVGSLNSGSLTVNLSRNSDATAADAGWALVGNPYPAPLDYSLVTVADRPGLDAAAYVVQSTGQYAGGYRSYVNGLSTSSDNNPLIASGQGFFVRVSQGQASGALTFRNSQRVATYATQAAFQRLAADSRPLVRLELAGAGLADAWVAYAEAGATQALDGQYDAAKLPNSTGLNLSSVTGPEHLAIDGRPAFTAAMVLPLAVGVPAVGTYTLTTTALANLPAGLTPYLHDAETGQLLPLTAGSSYSFSVTATAAQALVEGRFSVQFSAATQLATAPALLANQVSVYPNPAREGFTVTLPGIAGAAAVQAELLNALGQVVRHQQAALPAAGAQLPVATAGLAPGIYTLRLAAGVLVVTKRVTVQ